MASAKRAVRSGSRKKTVRAAAKSGPRSQAAKAAKKSGQEAGERQGRGASAKPNYLYALN